MIECIFCRAETREKRVTTEDWWGGALALVENVPAQVCEQCGEKYFDASTLEALADLRENATEPVKTVQVPVYRFPDVLIQPMSKRTAGKTPGIRHGRETRG